MEPKFMISEVFGTSWKYTKSQIWVLVGLFIGYFILSSIISLFGMPAQGSMVGKIIVNLISAVISSAFMLGYIKNLFQTMDGEEPQFSAYGGSNPVKSSLILLPVSLWGSQWLSEYSY